MLINNLIADTQADNKEWLLPTLITTRLTHLEDELSREPEEFTWSMPNASVRKSTITALKRHIETVHEGKKGNKKRPRIEEADD